MPIAPPNTPPAPLSYKVYDIVRDALIEIGAVAPGEYPASDEAQWAFRKFNYLTDDWSARKAYVYSYAFNLYTLVAGLSPHTIGPSELATFSTNGAPRPVKIESASLLLNDGSTTGPIDLPINLRDHEWWAKNQVKNIQTDVPTDLYYDPTSPDGSLFFWPVPNIQRQVRLEIWQTVSQFVSIQDAIGGPGGPGTLPQGYRNALMLSLAESLLSGSNRAVDADLEKRARKARAAIFGNNDKSPRMSTQDAGMPKSGKGKPDFNWETGGYPGGPPQ